MIKLFKPKKKKMEGLGEMYRPASKMKSLSVETPDSMFFEGQIALSKLKEYLRNEYGDEMTVDEYVKMHLRYKSLDELSNALAAEQVDSVALAIYQVEKGKGIIIAHQTGIGKGRINAAMIRYAYHKGRKPIVITEKPSLFTDLYRDLMGVGMEDGSQKLEIAIGQVEQKIKYDSWEELSDEEKSSYDNNPENYEAFKEQNPTKSVFKYKRNTTDYDLSKGKHIRPFIVNTRDADSHIKDDLGNIIYKAPEKLEQDGVIDSGVLPDEYDFILATYSQVATGNKVIWNGGKKNVIKGKKAKFLYEQAKGNILILDESHNASGGSSSTGIIMRDIVRESKGTIFLSATFAKRSENMALYGLKTDLSEANMSSEQMANAVEMGGVALQEIISANLVSEGQLIRHERGMANTGAIVNWIVLDKTATTFGMKDYSTLHRKICDNITDIMQMIVAFQRNYVKGTVENMNQTLRDEQGEVALASGTADLGVRNAPYFSKVFQIVSQMLLAIKADAVADRAIQRLKEGKKPVIAFANTMEAFVKELDIDSTGKVNTDFSQVLTRGLEGVLRIQINDGWGKRHFEKIELDTLGSNAVFEYNYILSRIKTIQTGVMISPIDYVKQRIEAEGYKVGEVTGRNLEVIYEYLPKGLGRMSAAVTTGRVQTRRKENAADTFQKFQDNQIDCLMINQSGSTGKSAHAIPTKKVPANEVKQRVMIVWQPELDINTEIQKRGRINRTGQILPPIYDYLSSDIPAEKRLVMMLKSKLKSLDANTTSSQKTSKDLIQSEDFLNKYGDIVMKTLIEDDKNEDLEKSYYTRLDLQRYFYDAQKGEEEEQTNAKSEKYIENLAKSVSGRVALLNTKEQEKFYADMVKKYQAFVELKIALDEYDLEVETMDLKAASIEEPNIAVLGKSFTDSPFSGPTYVGLYEINNLRKPYTVTTLQEELKKREKVQRNDTKELVLNLLEQQTQSRITRAQTDYEKDKEMTISWFEALKNKTEEQQQKLQTKLQELIEEREEAIAYHSSGKEGNKRAYAELLDFFKLGRLLYVPQSDNSYVTGVCLGIKPYEDGQIQLNTFEIDIAVSNGVKKQTFGITGNDFGKLSGIMSQSKFLSNDNVLEQWQRAITSQSKDRVSALIVTGNILQAYTNDKFAKGRLIDFTMQDGSVKKGLLLPSSYMRESNWKSNTANVIAPLTVAVPIIRSKGQVSTSIGTTFFRQNGKFRMITALSKSKGGDVYTDTELLKYVDGGNFNSVSSTMVGIVDDSNLEAVCRILTERFGASVNLSATDFKMIQDSVNAQMQQQNANDAADKQKSIRLIKIKLQLLKLKAQALNLN
ncbi:strawberry notch C-terminal domain-containing protein [Cellulophaga sp. BC115SP]|uniref:strawberry notch C-terminal domain-containing protein n=1 Tax=Cellulophaga sp. BC115SP TaxID=2683263 RepID=UPI0014127871|nr:strawberry notch C-terminal domain-containing protein [Cellulophaga sp. BC115SP]NBB31655.1 DEAD/DEAH box helicase family protein [Cellulophaga sp. BC115SP]